MQFGAPELAQYLVVLGWQALQDSFFAVVMLAHERCRCQDVHLQHST